MFEVSLAEKIATIYQARASGHWGEFSSLGMGNGIVECDGVKAYIKWANHSLLVSFFVGNVEYIGCDDDLETAIKLGLKEAGIPNTVSRAK
jgi:hypothetical protein